MTMVPSNDRSDLMSFGQTKLEAGSLVPPRIKVIQQMSAEATRANNPVKVGNFFNTLTGEDFGDRLQFIPILPFQQRILLVRDDRRERIDEQLAASGLEPISSGTGLKCRSFDMTQGQGEPGIACSDCPLRAWEGNTPPLCTETYNVASMTTLGDLIIMSFQKSSAKIGKRVFSMIRMSRQKPWTRVYEATTDRVQNDRGIFFVPNISVTQEPVSPELLGFALDWARQLAGAPIDVTPIDEEEEFEGAPVPDADSPF